MKHDVTEKSSHQILAPAGVQQGHIQHYDVDALLLGKNPPLILDFFVVASQPVDALGEEQIVRLEFSDQLFILRPVEILARLFIHKNVLLRDGHFPQGDKLPILVLLTGAYPDVAVCIA